MYNSGGREEVGEGGKEAGGGRGEVGALLTCISEASSS